MSIVKSDPTKLFFLILIWFISSCSSEAPLGGEVVRVTDGDTVSIEPKNRGKRFTCRLYGIDAPETKKRDKPGQPYAQAARRELTKLVLGHTVEITTTGEKTHNREVCILRINSMDVNREMVNRGYAWTYRKHLKSPYASEYIEAENNARARAIGVWQQNNPMPPWEFKKRYWDK
jgi:endonuclease YncB( thermonuclease family)